MHPIKRGALIALFSFGTIAGFGSGIASVACHAGSCHQSRRAEFEDHVADVCTRAAERVQSEHAADRDRDYDRDRDRGRDFDRGPDPRFIPYGAPQWGWGPPPSGPAQWGPPGPSHARTSAPAPSADVTVAPSDAPVAE